MAQIIAKGPAWQHPHGTGWAVLINLSALELIQISGE